MVEDQEVVDKDLPFLIHQMSWLKLVKESLQEQQKVTTSPLLWSQCSRVLAGSAVANFVQGRIYGAPQTAPVYDPGRYVAPTLGSPDANDCKFTAIDHHDVSDPRISWY
jgi:hypothetical protein